MIPMLILSIENDDDRTFMTRLYLDHRIMMLRSILSVGCNIQDAEDVMNDTLIRLINHIQTLRKLNQHSMKKYVYSTTKTTAINHCVKHRRKTQSEYAFPEDFINITDEDQSTAEEVWIQLEDIQRLKDALKALPKYEYDVLFMREYDGLTDDEIASILGKKNNAVRAYASRAYRHAQEILAQNEVTE